MAESISRDGAVALWRRWNDDEGLRRHALAVEATMRFFAIKNGESADNWGITGLLHDIDFGRFPTEHCIKARPLLIEAGCPEWLVRAVQSHGWGLCCDIEPLTAMEKTLYAVDELTGFISACALVRPSRSVMDLEVRSVRKKWKMPAFAAGVNREVIEKGAAMMALDLDVLIEETILALRPVAKDIGLAG